MKTFLILLCFVLFGIGMYITIDEVQQVKSTQVKLEQKLDMLLSASKASIEAEVANLSIDSTFYSWQARYWTTKDAFILNKMSKAAADKANNLKQALQTIVSADSITYIESTTTFDKEVEQKQVSFSRMQ